MEFTYKTIELYDEDYEQEENDENENDENKIKNYHKKSHR